MSVMTAIENGTALFVDETRSHFELTGQDRAKFLHNFCTNDILRLSAGHGCEAFICNVKGRILGFVTVFVGETSLWLETVAGAAPGLMAHLDRYLIREDVQFADRSAEVAEILLCGPLAAGLLNLVFGDTTALGEGPVYRFRNVSHEGNALRLARIDWLGDPSWLIIAPQAAVAGLVQKLESAGAVRGTPEEMESLRIEAGFPQYGRDITEEHLAQEVGRTPRSISFTKGCYLGQEPIARLDALGHTNKELRRLQSDAPTPVIAGAVIRDADGTQDIGVVTSAAPDPRGNGSVALGYLKTRWTTSGSRVMILTDTGPIEAGVR